MARSISGEPPADFGSGVRVVLERPDLHRGDARDRRLTRPGERGIQIVGLDDPEAADVLFGLCEGPVRGDHSTIFHTHHRGSAAVMEPTGEDPGTSGLHLRVERIDVTAAGLQDLGRWSGIAIDVVDAEHVLRHLGSSLTRASGMGSCRLLVWAAHAAPSSFIRRSWSENDSTRMSAARPADQPG